MNGSIFFVAFVHEVVKVRNLQPFRIFTVHPTSRINNNTSCELKPDYHVIVTVLKNN